MAITAEEIEAEIRGSFDTTKSEWTLPADLTVSEQLKEGGSTGVRPNHALEAVKNPDSLERVEIGDGLSVGLIVKWIEQAGYHLVAEIVAQPDKTYIANAWRLYEAPRDISPIAAFARLVEAFGTIIQGTENELFIAKRPATPTGEVRGITDAGQNFAVNAFIKKTPEGVETSFIFGLDTGRYEEYVRRHQG